MRRRWPDTSRSRRSPGRGSHTKKPVPWKGIEPFPAAGMEMVAPGLAGGDGHQVKGAGEPLRIRRPPQQGIKTKTPGVLPDLLGEVNKFHGIQVVPNVFS
jgi:hypothetical protein